jgi:hypothetical protein
MESVGILVFSGVLAAFLLVVALERTLVDAIIEAIGNFRGGPPAPPRPSPTDDTVLLRRPSRRTADHFR